MTQFIKLGRDNFRNLTVRLSPERDYSSGSSGAGITGSVHLFSHTSSVEYVQVLDDSASEYPNGDFWANGVMASFVSGANRTATFKTTYPDPLQGDSPHNIRVDYKNNEGQFYFVTKSNPEFFITRFTPLSLAEEETLLKDGDVYTYLVNDNVRYWSINPSDKYIVSTGEATVNEELFSTKKWFDEVDITDLNSDGIPPKDDGEYRGGNVTGDRQFIKQTIHKIDSSRVQKDIAKVNIARNTLMPSYRVENPSMDYSYTNYHCINFFSSSDVSDNAAMIYRSPQDPVGVGGELDNELKFGVSSSFTIETWIKPTGPQTRAGTILHYSGNYALSLITASSDLYDYGDDRFKLLLQLSSSAGGIPSFAVPNISDITNLVFTSSHSLKKNNWHHVAVRWDKDVNVVGNTSRGDFIIDGVIDSSFYITSSVLSNQVANGEACGLRSWLNGFSDAGVLNDPRQLVVGNFYENNTTIYAGNSTTFFNSKVSGDEGLFAQSTQASDPTTLDFNNPLNAEIHEVRIWKDWRDLDQIKSNMSKGLSNDIVTNASASGLKFYLPLMYIEQVSQQDQYKYTPKKTQELIQQPDGTLYTTASTAIHPYPFNVPLAMGTNGYEMNIQNFLRDFARRQNSDNTSGMPRLYNLTASISDNSATDEQSATEALESPTMLRRNLTILPCDNGMFVPNFDICSLLSESAGVDYPFGRKYKTSYGVNYPINTYANISPELPTYDYSTIRLDNLAYYKGYGENIDYFFGKISEISNTKGDVIATPRFPSADYVHFDKDAFASTNLTQSVLYYIPQMLQSSASNNVVCFDVPSLFYGRKIREGSLYIRDTNITGSDSQFQITLKDDGRGGLYRHNCNTEPATWNNVGNVFYNEGFILVKSPHLYMFGKDKFSMGFSGTLDKHISTLEFEVPKIFADSSSNPGYRDFVSDSPEKSRENTIISNINVYDKDFNIVARASLNQPVAKEKDKDKLFIRLNMDY